MRRIHACDAVGAGAGLVILAGITCALFGHHVGLPSLMTGAQGTGFATLLPLFAPMLAFLALAGLRRAG